MEDSGAYCPFLCDLDSRRLNRWSSACKIRLNSVRAAPAPLPSHQVWRPSSDDSHADQQDGIA